MNEVIAHWIEQENLLSMSLCLFFVGLLTETTSGDLENSLTDFKALCSAVTNYRRTFSYRSTLENIWSASDRMTIRITFSEEKKTMLCLSLVVTMIAFCCFEHSEGKLEQIMNPTNCSRAERTSNISAENKHKRFCFCCCVNHMRMERKMRATKKKPSDEKHIQTTFVIILHCYWRPATLFLFIYIFPLLSLSLKPLDV